MSTTTEATTTTIPVTLIWPAGEDIADLDVADAVVVSDRLEQVDIGGGGVLHGRYLRFSGEDLVVAAEELRRLADRIIDAVLDARQARMDAQRHECPGCPTLIDPDENTCGAASCERIWAMDCAGLIP